MPAELDGIGEFHVMEELANIVTNAPLWQGDAITHTTLKMCEERGWASRDYFGRVMPTELGRRTLQGWASDD